MQLKVIWFLGRSARANARQPLALGRSQRRPFDIQTRQIERHATEDDERPCRQQRADPEMPGLQIAKPRWNLTNPR